MQSYSDKVKKMFSTKGFRKTVKIIGYSFIGLFSLLLIAGVGLRIYFESNKTEIVSKINEQINDNILGKAKIGKVDYRFLIGFPNFTVVLKEVELKDSLIAIHKRPLLKAGNIEVRLNVLNLLKNEVNIHKIVINDATIDLYKDKNGISNSNLFKPKKKKVKTESSTTTSIDEVVLKNVNFISENQKRNKMFSFQIESLKCKIDFSGGDWETEVHLKTFVKSLAFNSKQGSFAKDKRIEGKLAVRFSEEENIIRVNTTHLKIGKDDFNIKAYFNVAKDNAAFAIAIRTTVLWKNASNLLSNNISSKLNQFDLKIPFPVSCGIKGDMSVAGDPVIVVNAVMKNNELITSYGTLKDCNFNGKFTNYYQQGLGCNDPNSAVIITNFKGELEGIPIHIPSGIINNLEKPVATGKISSAFDVVKLKNMIDEHFLRFKEGTAKVDLDFKVDIVDLRLNRPRFTGNIIVENTSFHFKPKNMNFVKTGINLHFTDQYLLIKNLKIQNGKNIVFMEGKIDNFLNLYYDAPEKMMVSWKAHSPYLDIKQMIRTLSYHDKSQPAQKPTSKSAKKASSNELREVFSKSQASIDLVVDKMAFNKMSGSDFKMNMLLINGGLYVKNGSMRGNTGADISFDAQLVPQKNILLFKSNIDLSNGSIANFLASFNNFGVKSFNPNDIKGKLSLSASLSGILDSERNLVQNSLKGDFNFHIKNGALINFKPIQKMGTVAFPKRNVAHITFSDLYAITTINQGKINVSDFKITSNVLNMDASGVYSLSNTGTDLGVKIPLRNPKDDYAITDVKQREALRYKGIVVNLNIVDGNDGETKIKLGKSSGEVLQDKQNRKAKREAKKEAN